MQPYSRTTARELGMKVKEAEAVANGAPIPEAVAMRIRMSLRRTGAGKRYGMPARR
jgi:hypothetical protein